MKKLTTATVIGFLLIALIPTTRSEGEKVHQTALVHFFENRCRPLIRLPYSLTKKLLLNRSIKPGTALSIRLLFLQDKYTVSVKRVTSLLSRKHY